MNKYLKYSIFGVLLVGLIFFLYFCVSVFGQYFWLNGLEKTVLNNYKANYEQTYSKTQTPENLFALFKERIINKDKQGIKVMTVPMFGSFSQDLIDQRFETFWDKYSKYDFSNSSFVIKKDSSYYFEIKNALNIPNDNQILTEKIYFSEVYLDRLNQKINKFPIKNYYVLVTE